MPYLGSEPAQSSLVAEDIADSAVTSAKINDGDVTTAKLNDNAITLAKMAGGTDGNLISYDASGDPVAIATGNDGQVLHSAGAGAPPAFETLSAGWEFVQSVSASTSSTIDLGEGNLASGYDYQIDCKQVDNSADLSEANCPRLQFGTSTGPTYQTASYNNQMSSFCGTAEDGGTNATTAGIPVCCFGNLGGATAGETWDAVINISNPAASAEHRVMSMGCGHNSAGTETLFWSGGHREATEVVTGLRLLPGTGTFISGTFILSRRAIA